MRIIQAEASKPLRTEGVFRMNKNIYFKFIRFSSAYTPKDYPVEVKLRQHLYFQASVKTKDKTLSVLAENCYSTPSKNRNHDDKYHLIKDG